VRVTAPSNGAQYYEITIVRSQTSETCATEPRARATVTRARATVTNTENRILNYLSHIEITINRIHTKTVSENIMHL